MDSHPKPFRVLRRQSIWIPLLLLVCTWALLYLPNLRTSPAWYGDETYVVGNGKKIFEGEFVNYAIKNTFFHVSYPYQLPYSWLSGAFFKQFGGDILGCRFFNTLIGLACALCLFLLGRRHFGVLAAFFQSLTLLVYTQSVIHYRYTFAHNGVGLGLLLSCLFLLNKASFKNDLSAGWGILIAGACHPLVTHVAIASFLCRMKRPLSWVALALPYSVLLVITCGLVYWKYGLTLSEDLASYYRYYGQSSSMSSPSIFSNVYRFFSQDTFHFIALVGLLLCLTKRLYPVFLCALVPTFLLLQNRANIPVFYYQAMMVLPLLAVGFTHFFNRLSRWLVCLMSVGARKWLRWLPLLPCAIYFVSSALQSVAGTLTPRNAYWTTQSLKEVEAAAEWLNERVTAEDLVICNPNIAWLLHSRAAHYLQAVAWRGAPTHGFENGISHDRFVFSPELTGAKYAVIGDIDLRWTVGEPGVRELFHEMEMEKWPIVWQSSTYMILQNPKPTR